MRRHLKPCDFAVVNVCSGFGADTTKCKRCGWPKWDHVTRTQGEIVQESISTPFEVSGQGPVAAGIAPEPQESVVDLEAVAVPISQVEPQQPVSATMPDVFKAMVEQPEDTLVMMSPWVGDDAEREAILNDVATMSLHFTIARLMRAQQAGINPQAFTVELTVKVEGGIEVAKSELFVP